MNNETNKEFTLNQQEILFLRKVCYELISRKLPNTQTITLQELIKHFNLLYSTNRELFTECPLNEISTGLSFSQIRMLLGLCLRFKKYTKKPEEKLMAKQISSKINNYTPQSDIPNFLHNKRKSTGIYYNWLNSKISTSLYDSVSKIIVSEENHQKSIKEMIRVFLNTQQPNQLNYSLSSHHLWNIFESVLTDLEKKGVFKRKRIRVKKQPKNFWP